MRLPKCPVCQKSIDPLKTTAFPFCSARCRTIDLGRWLDEKYPVPEPLDPEAEDDPSEHRGDERE